MESVTGKEKSESKMRLAATSKHTVMMKDTRHSSFMNNTMSGTNKLLSARMSLNDRFLLDIESDPISNAISRNSELNQDDL